MNNAAFGKTMEIVRKRGDIKPVATNKGKSYLISKPNYHTTKWFSEKFISDRNEEKQKLKWITHYI